MAPVLSMIHSEYADRLCLCLRTLIVFSQSHGGHFMLYIAHDRQHRQVSKGVGPGARGQATITLVGIADHHSGLSHAIPLQ